MELKICGIAARNKHHFIGKAGKLMWKSTADFSHFKRSTQEGICIVGETTYEIDLGGKGLPKRKMFIVGNKLKGYLSSGEAIIQAIKFATENKKDKIWVIGGQSIYEQFMPFIDEFHLSIINDDQIGDRSLEIPDNFRGNVIKYYFDVDEKLEENQVSLQKK